MYLHKRCLGEGTNVDLAGQVGRFRQSFVAKDDHEHLILLPLSLE